ncbi:alpha/beta hydrolase [Halobacteriovorax sp. GB3]|uniref:alpha/beta hydrolase n=1 Tax=Halobacteriovorax sp. GB3 TaxID=2719615 RepID=UPI002362BC7B|nr:alpha/beta hydrolase [Halobacteriovorax sp. GB3]MDD0851900.1 alpha/beta hydrolase [Halobacteriovorax sp. GB3]
MPLEFKKVKNGQLTISYAIQRHGEGPNLVILPGALATKWDYTGFDEFFSKDDNKALGTVISLDFRGRGESELPEDEKVKIGFSVDDHLSDVAAVIDEVGLNSFYIVGHSFGAALGLKYAINNRDKVLGLIVGDYVPFCPPFDSNWKEKIEKRVGQFNIHPDLPSLLKDGFKPEGFVHQLSEIDGLPLLIIKGQFLSNDKAMKMWSAMRNTQVFDGPKDHDVYSSDQTRKRVLNFCGASLA